MKRKRERMKKILLILFLFFSLAFFSSCLRTLYPIFHKRDAIFNESLLGYWKCTDKAKNISFVEFKRIPVDRKTELPPSIREISEKGYFVSGIDSTGKIKSQDFVFLAKIGKNHFLDYYPAEGSESLTKTDTNESFRENIKSLSGSNLNVYPNPASGVVSILFSTIETSKIKLELYDMSGKLVKNLYEGVLNKNAQRKIELQTKSLPAGIYMVSLQTGNRIVSRNKLVVTN